MISPVEETLFFRVDADTASGAGHLMRCLALAQAWQAEGGRTVFIGRYEHKALRARIRAVGASWVPVERSCPDSRDLTVTRAVLAQAALSGKPPWLALDGYHFHQEYQAALGEVACLLIIDDNNDRPLASPCILLNQNIHARNLTYDCPSESVLLLGTDYVLLRKEFLARGRPLAPVPERARNILVTMGQSDPTRATSILVEALGLLPAGDFSVRVILDHRHPDFTEVSVRCAALPFPAEVLCHVEDMPGVLRWAHLVLTAAGSTCWELAYLGIPALTVLTAENQRGVATSLDERGVFPVLDRREKLSADAAALALLKVIENRELRERMSRAGRALVDGGGARRVVSALRCQGLGVTPGAGMGGIQP